VSPTAAVHLTAARSRGLQVRVVCGGGEGEGRSGVVDRASMAVFGGGVTRTDGTLGRRGRAYTPHAPPAIAFRPCGALVEGRALLSA
jgi:hypothetical protein